MPMAPRAPVAGPEGPCDWIFDGDVLRHPELGRFPSQELEEGEEEIDAPVGAGSPRTCVPVTADLDGDPEPDAIIELGLCGNWQHCWHVVLQACGRGAYRAVWGPDYAQSVEVGRRRKTAPIADLIHHDRTATAGCDVPLETVLRWRAGGWTEGETCAGESDVWDDEYCGPRPPACDRARPAP